MVGKLLTQGLIEEIPARGALPIRRRDKGKGSFAVHITRRGLAAIGVAKGSAWLEAEESSGAGRGADPARDKPARRAAAARRKKTGNEARRLSAKPGRSDSKQALVLTMLQRKQGATALSLCRWACRSVTSAVTIEDDQHQL